MVTSKFKASELVRYRKREFTLQECWGGSMGEVALFFCCRFVQNFWFDHFKCRFKYIFVQWPLSIFKAQQILSTAQ